MTPSSFRVIWAIMGPRVRVSAEGSSRSLRIGGQEFMQQANEGKCLEKIQRQYLLSKVGDLYILMYCRSLLTVFFLRFKVVFRRMAGCVKKNLIIVTH